MKITLQKQILKPIMGDLVGLTSRKTNLAVTENVLITAKKGTHAQAGMVTLSATDLETGFEGVYPATVEEEGAIAISGRRLSDIVAGWPYSEITIHEVENRWVEIAGDSVEYHMVGMNPDDFPDLPDVDSLSIFEVPAPAMANAVHRSCMAAAGDDTREHILGVHLVHLADEKVLRFESTDSNRLHISDVGYESAGDLPDNILIPKKGLDAAKKFLARCAAVRIGIGGGQCVIQSADSKETGSFFLRLLEGDYPDIDGILDQRARVFEARVDREKFMSTLRRMSVFLSPGYNALSFAFDKNLLTVRASNPDIGESMEELSISYSGDPVESFYNGKYLADAVAAIGWGDSIRMEFLKADGPLFITGSDKGFLAVVMPMRM